MWPKSGVREREKRKKKKENTQKRELPEKHSKTENTPTSSFENWTNTKRFVILREERYIQTRMHTHAHTHTHTHTLGETDGPGNTELRKREKRGPSGL